MKRFLNSGAGILLILLIIRNVLDGRWSDPAGFIYDTLVLLPGIIIGLSLHEYGHAIASYKLGDPTPQVQGRVSINPMAHIDPFGFVALIFCGFGWGKPVMIDPSYYKHPRRDELIVSLAGVTMNLILAIAFSFILKFYLSANPNVSYGDKSVAGIVLEMLIYAIQINLVLMVFNLIPVPPLDGFGVITEIFDLKKWDGYWTLYNNGMMILMLLLLFGVVGKILSPAVSVMFRFMLDHIIY